MINDCYSLPALSAAHAGPDLSPHELEGEERVTSTVKEVTTWPSQDFILDAYLNSDSPEKAS